jgi:hypothetical protein
MSHLVCQHVRHEVVGAYLVNSVFLVYLRTILYCTCTCLGLIMFCPCNVCKKSCTGTRYLGLVQVQYILVHDSHVAVEFQFGILYYTCSWCLVLCLYLYNKYVLPCTSTRQLCTSTRQLCTSTSILVLVQDSYVLVQVCNVLVHDCHVLVHDWYKKFMYWYKTVMY